MGEVVNFPVERKPSRSDVLKSMTSVQIDEIVAAHDEALATGGTDEAERLGNLLDEIGRERRIAGLSERPAA